MKSRTYIFYLAVVFVFCKLPVNAQAEFSEIEENLDSSILHGRLDNGLTYFIKPLEDSVPKLHLRMYNKVGRNQEDIDQMSAAHAVEHLAFKSSDLFPEGIRDSDIREKFGLSMYDFTAYNGNKETLYDFNVPTNNSKALKTGFLWFKDILTGLHLRDKDISTVKGELRQEFLLKNDYKLEMKHAESSLYANLFTCQRSSRDFLENLENIKPGAFRRFYKDWYRPDLMAITVVGNIQEPERFENLIIESFSDLDTPSDPRELFDCDDAFYSRPPQFTVVEHSTKSTKLGINEPMEFHLFYRDSILAETINTTEGLQRKMKLQLLLDILNARLKELADTHPFSEIRSRDTSRNIGLQPTMEIIISHKGEMEKKPLINTVQIVQQFQRYGALEKEWELGKQKLLESLDSYNTDTPNYWRKELQNYLNNEALPSKKRDLLRHWLKNLTREKFNEYVSIFLDRTPEDIGIIAPTGHESLKYKEKEVRFWIQDAYRQQVPHYELRQVSDALMTEKEIQQLKVRDYYDQGSSDTAASEIILKNGVKVILHSFEPYGIQKNKIYLHGFSLKGTADFHDEDYASAINAPGIIMSSGVNGMSNSDLKLNLSENRMGRGLVRPYIDIQETGIQAYTILEDLEIMMQLVYLYFTKPNKDDKAFNNWKRAKVNAYQNSAFNMIGGDNNSAIRRFTGDNFMSSIFGLRVFDGTDQYNSIAQTELDRAFEIYERLFQNASDFTFIISGDYKIEQVLPSIQKYLGNLPVLSDPVDQKPKREATNPLAPGPVSISFTVPGDYDLKNTAYSIRYIKTASDLDDWQEAINVSFLGLITTHMAWALRFEKGYSIYDVAIDGVYNADMNRFEIGGTFNCVPEEFPLIQKEVHQIISEIKAGRISKVVIEEAISRLKFLYSKEQVNSSRGMQKRLYEHYRYGLPWVESEMIESYVKSLTVEDAIKTAQDYFNNENLFEFIMQ